MKPIIKWTGGKFNQRHVLDVVRAFYNPLVNRMDGTCRKLVEPFCGGLGMTFALCPTMAILNDINLPLIQFYEAIALGLDWDQKYLELLKSEGYLELKKVLNSYLMGNIHLKPAEFMTVFYLINKSCFNGLWRVNKKGFFNTPIGRNSKGEIYIPSFPDLEEYRGILKDWQFYNLDYETFLKRIDLDNSIVYVDSPYDKIVDKDSFVGYTQGGFNWNDQENLAEILSRLDCPVIASNAATDKIIEMYLDLDFQLFPVTANRSLTAKVQEVVMIRNFKN